MKSLRHNPRMFGWALHLTGLAAVGLVLGVFYALVDCSFQEGQLAATERATQLEKLLASSTSVRNEHLKLTQQLRTMQKAVEEVNHYFETPTTESSFLREANRIAQSTQLQVLDYQVGLKKSTPTHSQTEVQLRCNGSYASICYFLHKIEQLTKTTKLSKLKLTGANNLDGYPIQMTFVLYSEVTSHDTKEKRGVL